MKKTYATPPADQGRSRPCWREARDEPRDFLDFGRRSITHVRTGQAYGVV